MFERSLSSLIKGLRSHRGRDERKYVATVMEEIKHEIRSGDMDVKAEAVLKLTYVSHSVVASHSKSHWKLLFSCKCWGIHPQMHRFICSKLWPRLAFTSKSSAI